MYAIDPLMLGSLRNGQSQSIVKRREDSEFSPAVKQNPSYLKHNLIRIKTKKATSTSLPKIFSLRISRSIDYNESSLLSSRQNRFDSREVNLAQTVLPQFQDQVISHETHQESLGPLRKDIEMIKLLKKAELRDQDRLKKQQKVIYRSIISDQIPQEPFVQTKSIEQERPIKGQLRNRDKKPNSLHFKTEETTRRKIKNNDDKPSYYSPKQEKPNMNSNLVQKVSINNLLNNHTNSENDLGRVIQTEGFGESGQLSPKYIKRGDSEGELSLASSFEYLFELSRKSNFIKKRENLQKNCIDDQGTVKVSAKSWCIYDLDMKQVYQSKGNLIAREITTASNLMVYFTAHKYLQTVSILGSHCKINLIESAGCFPEGSSILLSEALTGMLLTNRPEFSQIIAKQIGTMAIINISNYYESLLHGVSTNRAEEVFVNLMNENAQFLGMNQAKFQSINGEKNRENIASCADIVQLSCACLKIGEFKEIVKRKEYLGKFEDQDGEEKEAIWFNQNKLIEKGFSGIHTGLSLDTSKPYIASFIKIKDSETGVKKQLIIVMLDCYTLEDRWTDTVRLARWTIKQLGQQPTQQNND